MWSTYKARIENAGSNKRSETFRRESHWLWSRLKDSLSYHNAIVDGKEREVAIINSDNLNEKLMYSMPGEDIRCGCMVEWMDNHWIAIEKDANNEIYTKVKLLQCNYLLKWIEVDENKVPHIIEQWCTVEDGTKLERINMVRNSLACWKRHAKRTLLIAGNSLEPYPQSGMANSHIRDGLKTIRIGQSAAKPRTGERSTVRLVAAIGTSVPKRRALNRNRGMVKI